MKTNKFILVPLVLTAVFTSISFAEPEKPKAEKILHKITIEKLELEIQNSPRFSVNGPNMENPSSNKEWLEIEAKLNIESLTNSTFLPSLQATFHLVTKGEKEYERIEKKITFKNVNIENGQAWVCAYVDPDTLRIITEKKRPKVTDVTGVAVTIDADQLFKGKDQKFIPYAEEIFDHRIVRIRKENSNATARWWDNVNKSKHEMLTLEETPFSSIISDRYPRAHIEIKTAMR